MGEEVVMDELEEALLKAYDHYNRRECFADSPDGMNAWIHYGQLLDIVRDERKQTATLRKMLDAYQKAFNKVDDRMEYTGLSKDAFKEIAAELTSNIERMRNEKG